MKLINDDVARVCRVANVGERHVPALDPESKNHYRHLTAYHYAIRFAEGRRVLDYGCGAGYGTNLIWRRGRSDEVVGIDLSCEAIAYCRSTYADLATHYQTTTPGDIPFGDGSFDVVLFFQVIEHLTDDVRALDDIRRVLRPGGVVLLTTPNLLMEKATPNAASPANQHHVREYTPASLGELCAKVFHSTQMLGVHGSHRVGGRGIGGERWLAYRLYRRMARRFLPSIYVAPLSLADFSIEPYDLNQALDLFAICRRDA
jgi:2-polyprenyl-3-methyl-5-hydroxy-6-metoxy-1,4-benzoquinol methylase